MKRKIIFLLTQYLIFQAIYGFVNAIVGINVKKVKSGEYLSAVCIMKYSNMPTPHRQDILCSGTLITRDHVLTAEHCMENIGNLGIYVLAGSVDLKKATPSNIHWWLTYKQWTHLEGITMDASTNDVAVLKLLREVSGSIQPALLPPTESKSFVGENVTMTGWGKLLDNIKPYVLHAAQVTVIPNENCKKKVAGTLGRTLNINDRYICSLADPPALMHNGDSGGPLFHGSFIIGTNYGTIPDTGSPLDPRKANLYCSVIFYRRFIEETMRM